jgi:hypothetical protein
MAEVTANGGDRVAQLLVGPRGIINLGLATFAEVLLPFGVPVLHVDWQPPAGGDPDLLRLLRTLERQ